MKKSVLFGIIGMAAGVASTYGQGFISLDNYSAGPRPLVTFGAGSGGTVGAGVTGGTWTVGLYFALGNVAGDATSGNGAVSGLLALGTGGSAAGATTGFLSGGYAGLFANSTAFQATVATPGNGGTTVTVEVVAYNGANYASSTIRGHSSAFQMLAFAGTAFSATVGDPGAMSTFGVTPVPEPTTLALAGLGGLASLVMLRRKNA